MGLQKDLTAPKETYFPVGRDIKKQPSARNGCFKIWFSFVFWFLVPEQVLYSGTTPILSRENACVNSIFYDPKTVEKWRLYGISSVQALNRTLGPGRGLQMARL